MSDVKRRNFMRAAAGALAVAGLGASPAPRFDVRRFGATGNGSTLDTAALNRAIAAASQAGGGTVEVPAGTYVCDSIRLKSRVTLRLAAGATIVAAPPGGFDPAEPNAPWEAYQDYGHNHFCNSLIWGENLHDVAIEGPGLIWGRGLSRGTYPEGNCPPATKRGVANKTIALKNCRNVSLRDFSILAGGHFGILATGVDNLTIDRLTIDTNRDGMNLDCCRVVSVTRCRVNSPSDDGICLKSSFALGEARATEHVTIRDCYVTGGYRVGSFLDGTKKRLAGPDPYWRMTGRIKLGTESAGGFRDIAIADCVFESCLGVALETVDGGALEDVSVRGIVMRDVRNAPFFLRLGDRLDAPPGTKVGSLRRVVIRDLACHGPANTMPAMIVGIPGHPIEDIVVRDVYLEQRGGDPATMAAAVPSEEERLYPEPAFFDPVPAQGLFARHVRGLELDHVEFASVAPDARPVIWLQDVHGERFSQMTMPRGAATPIYRRSRPRTAAL
jgi:polygalacturonase